MNSLVSSPQECIILDACCAINLSASGHFDAILAAVENAVAIARYVLERELMQWPIASPVSDAVNTGQVIVVSPGDEDEENMYLELASMNLDNGEAVTGAIAYKRGWTMATDERRARNVFTRKLPQVALLGTPELVHHWELQIHPPTSVVTAALQDIRTIGRYEPPRDHPLYGWWFSKMT